MACTTTAGRILGPNGSSCNCGRWRVVRDLEGPPVTRRAFTRFRELSGSLSVLSGSEQKVPHAFWARLEAVLAKKFEQTHPLGSGEPETHGLIAWLPVWAAGFPPTDSASWLTGAGHAANVKQNPVHSGGCLRRVRTVVSPWDTVATMRQSPSSPRSPHPAGERRRGGLPAAEGLELIAQPSVPDQHRVQLAVGGQLREPVRVEQEQGV